VSRSSDLRGIRAVGGAPVGTAPRSTMISSALSHPWHYATALGGASEVSMAIYFSPAAAIRSAG